MKRYFCIVSYDGTNYNGWQIQDNYKSVQEEIQKCLCKILNVDTKIYSSGRTDKGVHALGQTFHFDSKQIEDINKFRYALNRILPFDIHIKYIKEVGYDFNSRFDAKYKIYQYKINCIEQDVFSRLYVYQYYRKLDIEKMKMCINLFKGKHCFQNFTSKEEDDKGFIREIYDIYLNDNNGLITLSFKGNGFMKYMVRMLVGTLIEVGSNKITLKKVEDLLESKERNVVCYKAPSNGLTLMGVNYD